MAFKAVIVLCAQALLIHSGLSQCIGAAGRAPFGLGRPGVGLAGPALGLAGPTLGLAGPALGLAGPALGPGYGNACGAGVASTGGGFPVTSASPIAPTGVSVVSENAIEGALSVEGNLPLLGSVALEGAFPTAGAGAVSYGCGNGAVGIESESPIATGILAPGPVGPAPGPIGAAGLGMAGPYGTGLGLGGPLGTGIGLGAGTINGLGYNGLGRGIGGPCGAVY